MSNTTKTAEATKSTAIETTKPGAIVPFDTSSYESVGDIAKQEEGNNRKKTPYVGLFTEKTKTNVDAIKAAGVEFNQFYLFDSEPLKVKPFQFHLLKYRRFYTKVNKDGETTGVLLSKPNDHQYKVERYREYLMALVLVVTKDPMGKTILVPATWGTRSGVCKVFSKAINFMLPGGAAEKKDTWASRSTKHAIAANARWPSGRFVISAYSTLESTSDGENEYNLGHDSVNPTEAEGVAAFNELTSGKNLQEILAPADATWQWHVKRLEAQAKETAGAK